jgi:hypothetical protein
MRFSYDTINELQKYDPSYTSIDGSAGQSTENELNLDRLGVYQWPVPYLTVGIIHDPDREFGKGSVWTLTETQSDSPEPFETQMITCPKTRVL